MFSDNRSVRVLNTNSNTVFDKNVVPDPFNFKVGNFACDALQCCICCSTSLDFSWKTALRDDVESTVGCFQFFGDKSRTSLSAGSLNFDHPHVTLLNIAEEHWRKFVIKKNTIVANLRTIFYLTKNSFHLGGGYEIQLERITNRQNLDALHKVFEFALKSLRKIAQIGITISIHDGKHLLVHLLLTLNLANHSETEDLLSKKRGLKMYSPCHIYLAKWDKTSDFARECRRKRDDTRQFFAKHGCPPKKNTFEQTLIMNSMHPSLPVISSFPL